MDRAGLAVTGVALALVPLVVAACGDDGDSGATLPPIVTIATTTTSNITTTTVATYYIVKPGDNLGNIARLLGVNLDELMRLNNISNPNLIDVGQPLLIPPATVLIETLPTG